MRFKSICLLFMCLLVLSISVCQAEERKDEWKSPDFDFRNIKTILISTSTDPGAQLDEFNIRKLETFYSNVFIQDGEILNKSNFKFITLNQLIERISSATGENMRQLEVEDPVQYKAQIDKFTPIIADAILNINVTSSGYEERFVPKSYYTYTEQVETEIETRYRDSHGRWKYGKKIIKQPVKRIRRIPAHYDTYANAGMKYKLIDAKTNEPIWMLLDIREARGKEPIYMLERIINRAADRLIKI